MSAWAGRLRNKSAIAFLLLTTLSLALVTLTLNRLGESYIAEDARQSVVRLNDALLSLLTPEIAEGNHDLVRRFLIHTAIPESVVRIAVLDRADRIIYSSRRGEEGLRATSLTGYDPTHGETARQSNAPEIVRPSGGAVAFTAYTGVYSPKTVTTKQPKRDWLLFLQTDWQAEIAASRRRLLFEAGAIWATLILLCGLGYILMHRCVTRPIEDLRTIMRRFADGETSVRASVDRTDEIGELASQFNELSENVLTERSALAQRNEQLEREVDARRSAEETAATMSRRLLDAVESLPLGFLLNDRHGLILLSNARYRTMVWDGDADDAAPGRCVDAMIPRFQARFQPTYLTADNPQRTLDLAERLRLRHGGGGSFIIRYPSGRVLRIDETRTAEGGMVSVFTDETDRRRAEQFLQTSAEVAKVAGWWVEPNAMHMELSRELRGILGIQGEERTDLATPLPGIAPNDWQKLTEIVATTARTCQAFDHVLPWSDAEGNQRFARMIGHPDLSGESCTGVYGALQDITEVKRREAAERERETMVSLGRLAAGVAHEINNLLHPVLNSTKMAMRRIDSPPAEVPLYLESVLRNTYRLRDLVARVLAFARRSATERSVRPFRPLLTEAIELIRPRVPPLVRLEVIIDHGDENVHSSPHEVSQIITNLVVNAIDALETGGYITITSTLVTEAVPEEASPDGAPTPDTWFLLTVRDDGPGMDEKTREGAFEPFFTTKPTGQGTGLGLPIVKTIVTDLHGRIAIESAPGEGCAVRIWIPVHQHGRSPDAAEATKLRQAPVG